MLINFMLILQASSLNKSDVTIMLPPNKTHIFHLENFLHGNNLTFKIECNEGNENFDITQGPLDYKIFQTKNIDHNVTASIRQYRMPIYTFHNFVFSLFFSQSNLIAIQSDVFSGKSKVQLNLPIISLVLNFKITSVLPIGGEGLYFIAAVVGDGYLNGNLCSRMYFVHINIMDVQILEKDEIHIKGLDTITNIVLYSNIGSEWLAMTGVRHLSLYIIIAFSSNKFMSNTNTYIFNEATMPATGNTFKLNPIDMKIFKNSNEVNLLILNSDFALMQLIFQNGKFEIKWMYYLKNYGKVLKMYTDINKHSDIKVVYIATSQDILSISLLDYQKMRIFPVKHTEDIKILGIYTAKNSFYILYQNNLDFKIYISAMPLKHAGFFNKIFEINHKGFYPDSSWSIISGISDVYLVRHDPKYVTSIKIEYILPILKVELEKNNSCKLIAKGLETHDRIKINFTIIEKPNNPNLIYQGAPYTNPLIADGYLGSNILPTYMVSGLNISCSIKDYPKQDFYEIDDLTPKLVSIFNTLPKNLSTTYTVVGKYLIAVNSDYILISEIGVYSFLRFNISGVSSMTYSEINKDKNVLFFIRQNILFECNYLIINGSIYNKDFTELSLKLVFNPLFVVAFNHYLAVSNSRSIFIYKLNSILKNFPYDLIYSRNNTYPIFHLDMMDDSNIDSPFILYAGHYEFITVYYTSHFNDKIVKDFRAPLKNLNGYTQIIAKASKLFLITENGILVYNSFFSQLLYQVSIKLEQVKVLGKFLIGKYSEGGKVSKEFFVIANYTENFLAESVYYMGKLSGKKILGFVYSVDYKTNVILENSTHLFLFNSSYPLINSKNERSVTYNFTLLNERKLNSSEIPMNITLDCSDGFNSLDLNYSVMIYTKLNIITQKKSLKNFTSDYVNSLSINLHDYFSGYNLNTTLLLNSHIVKNNQYSPIIVTQTLKFLNKFDSLPELKAISDITIIRHKKSALLATITGQIYLIPNIFEQGEIESLKFTFMENRICPTIKNYGSQNGLTLLVLGCTSNYSDLQSQLIIALINSSDYTLIDYIVEDLNFMFQSIHIIPGSLGYFAVAIILDVTRVNRINNNVVIFGLVWKGISISATWLENINYYTLSLTNFFCMSIDGYYNQNNIIELYILDRYFGFRIVTLGSKIVTDSSFEIEVSPQSLTCCGNVILINCVDSSILSYRRVNGKFSIFQKFPPFLENSTYQNYEGSITCNTYYDPRYFVVTLQSKISMIARVYDLKIDFSNSLINSYKIKVSDGISKYYSGGVFYNETVVTLFDNYNGVVMTLAIQDLRLELPKFSHDEFSIVEKTWGKSPYLYQLNVSNGKYFIITKIHTVDRGSAKHSGSSDDSDVNNYTVVGIFIAAFIFIVVATIVGYKLILRRKRANLKELKTIELDLRYSGKMTLN